MVMRGSAQPISKGGEWKGVLLMLLLVFVSILSINILGKTVSFVFLPLIGICLWPRSEGSVVSIIAILIFGLLLDLLSAGPLGLWALIFLSVFTLFRPHMRLKPHSFGSAFTQWLMALLFAIIASFLLGWFARQNRPDIFPLIYQAIAATLLFPVVYGFRHLGKHFLSDPDMRGP